MGEKLLESSREGQTPASPGDEECQLSTGEEKSRASGGGGKQLISAREELLAFAEEENHPLSGGGDGYLPSKEGEEHFGTAREGELLALEEGDLLLLSAKANGRLVSTVEEAVVLPPEYKRLISVTE